MPIPRELGFARSINSLDSWFDWMDLTDRQWELVRSILPEDPVRSDGRGRPWSERRKVINGILWMLRTGAPWQDLPER